uniref:Uncharacterized protein n=1 Tax=Brassica oleracea var. oleracea TaxID=109376 RepID=A0A0D3BGT1_BRAOL
MCQELGAGIKMDLRSNPFQEGGNDTPLGSALGKTDMHGLIMGSNKDICSLFDTYIPNHEASTHEITWKMPALRRPHKIPNRRCKEQFKSSRDEADQRRCFLQFDVQIFCDNIEKEMMKALRDVRKIQKKSTTTHAHVAEPSLFISEKPKETNGLTCFEQEHPSSRVLVSQDFEEEPFDYPHQGPLLDTRRPMDEDLGPIFDEEDELGQIFNEEAPSLTSINMENHLCFVPGTTPTPLSTNIQEHCEKLDLINSLPKNFAKINSQDVKHFGFDKFLKHSKGFDHLEMSLEIDLQQPVFCARKSFDSFVFKENGFNLNSYRHALVTGNLFASTCALDKFMVKTLLEQKSPRVETDFCDFVLKFDILLKRVLHVFGKDTLISDLNKYISCTYDPGILMFVLSVQDKQVQPQKSESIDHAHQHEIWRCMHSRDGAAHGCRRDDHISSQWPRKLDDQFNSNQVYDDCEESMEPRENPQPIPCKSQKLEDFQVNHDQFLREASTRDPQRTYVSRTWIWKYLRKQTSELQGSKMNLRSNPFQEGGNDVPLGSALG